jgi:HK97 family phage prohead protease
VATTDPDVEYRDRTWETADVHVRSDGGGRIVEAYITPFDHPTEIHDSDGHYDEVISQTAFNKTLADRGLNFAVLYNHGRTYDGRTDGNLMVPIGVPRLIEPRERGLYSETEYLENPLADAVLDGVKKRALRGYSFSGRFVKSARARGERSGRPLITRSEIALREYGPVLYPAYEAALVVGTRMADLIAQIGPDDVDRLRELLGIAADAVATPDSGAGLRPHEPTERHSVPAAHTIRLGRIRRGMIPKGEK